jgi:hypothetical protein
MTDETRETFGHEIQIDLSDEELAAGRKRNMQIDLEIDAIKERQSASNAVFKEELDILKREQKPLKEAEKTKKATIEIQCYHERDERRGIMLTMRCDNGEIVDERALTADERGAVEDERQGNLFDGGVPKLDAESGEDDEPAGDADSEAALDEYLAQSGAGESEETRAH